MKSFMLDHTTKLRTIKVIEILPIGISRKKYELVQLCEVYAYRKAKKFFEDFVNSVEGLKKTITDPVLLKFIKVGLNSSYGYFMLRGDRERYDVCSSLHRFQALLENDEVINFNSIGEEFLDVCYKNKTPRGTNCETNLTIGAHITSYARIMVDQKICQLKMKCKSAKIFMINCDAIAFTTDGEDSEDIETLSDFKLDPNKIGCFKQEVKDAKTILSFHALSPNSYHLTYTSKDGEKKHVSRVCGFSLNNALNSDTVDHNLYTKFISEALKGEQISKPIMQVRNFTEKNTGEVERKVMYFQLRNNLTNKRIVKEDLSTVPFGYDKKGVKRKNKNPF